MRIRCLVWLISAAGLGALLAGCSIGGSQPSAPGGQPQPIGVDNSVAVRPTRLAVRVVSKPAPFVDVAGIERAGRNLIALSDSDADDVTILGSRGGFYAVLSTGLSQPQGVAFDTRGSLYVANTSDSQVLVYPKPYTSVSMTLHDPGQYPAGVAVASDGTAGVTNIVSTGGGAGSVSIYAKGATSPCATVSAESFARIYFAAFDRRGNLYVDGTDAAGHFVAGRVTGECRATSIVPLSIRNTISSPGGVAVLRNGDIALGDQSDPNVTAIVYTYKPPSRGSLGAPTATTTLKAAYDVVDFAFEPSDRSLWVADAEAEDFAKYVYPAGGLPLTAYPNFEQPAGVAAYPPQP